LHTRRFVSLAMVRAVPVQAKAAPLRMIRF
jgi:hypothetical protein